MSESPGRPSLLSRIAPAGSPNFARGGRGLTIGRRVSPYPPADPSKRRRIPKANSARTADASPSRPSDSLLDRLSHPSLLDRLGAKVGLPNTDSFGVVRINTRGSSFRDLNKMETFISTSEDPMPVFGNSLLKGRETPGYSESSVNASPRSNVSELVIDRLLNVGLEDDQDVPATPDLLLQDQSLDPPESCLKAEPQNDSTVSEHEQTLHSSENPNMHSGAFEADGDLAHVAGSTNAVTTVLSALEGDKDSFSRSNVEEHHPFDIVASTQGHDHPESVIGVDMDIDVDEIEPALFQISEPITQPVPGPSRLHTGPSQLPPSSSVSQSLLPSAQISSPRSELLFMRTGLNGIDSLDIEFDASAVLNLAFGVGQVKLQFLLCCLQEGPASQLAERVRQGSPPDVAVSQMDRSIACWPSAGKLVVQINQRGVWFPSEMTGPLELTEFVSMGTNTLRLTHLDDLSNYAFLLFTSWSPLVPSKSDPPWKMYDWDSLLSKTRSPNASAHGFGLVRMRVNVL